MLNSAIINTDNGFEYFPPVFHSEITFFHRSSRDLSRVQALIAQCRNEIKLVFENPISVFDYRWLGYVRNAESILEVCLKELCRILVGVKQNDIAETFQFVQTVHHLNFACLLRGYKVLFNKFDDNQGALFNDDQIKYQGTLKYCIAFDNSLTPEQQLATVLKQKAKEEIAAQLQEQEAELEKQKKSKMQIAEKAISAVEAFKQTLLTKEEQKTENIENNDPDFQFEEELYMPSKLVKEDRDFKKNVERLLIKNKVLPADRIPIVVNKLDEILHNLGETADEIDIIYNAFGPSSLDPKPLPKPPRQKQAQAQAQPTAENIPPPLLPTSDNPPSSYKEEKVYNNEEEEDEDQTEMVQRLQEDIDLLKRDSQRKKQIIQELRQIIKEKEEEIVDLNYKLKQADSLQEQLKEELKTTETNLEAERQIIQSEIDGRLEAVRKLNYLQKNLADDHNSVVSLLLENMGWKLENQDLTKRLHMKNKGGKKQKGSRAIRGSQLLTVLTKATKVKEKGMADSPSHKLNESQNLDGSSSKRDPSEYNDDYTRDQGPENDYVMDLEQSESSQLLEEGLSTGRITGFSPKTKDNLLRSNSTQRALTKRKTEGDAANTSSLIATKTKSSVAKTHKTSIIDELDAATTAAGKPEEAKEKTLLVPQEEEDAQSPAPKGNPLKGYIYKNEFLETRPPRNNPTYKISERKISLNKIRRAIEPHNTTRGNVTERSDTDKSGYLPSLNLGKRTLTSWKEALNESQVEELKACLRNEKSVQNSFSSSTHVPVIKSERYHATAEEEKAYWVNQAQEEYDRIRRGLQSTFRIDLTENQKKILEFFEKRKTQSRQISESSPLVSRKSTVNLRSQSIIEEGKSMKDVEDTYYYPQRVTNRKASLESINLSQRSNRSLDTKEEKKLKDLYDCLNKNSENIVTFIPWLKELVQNSENNELSSVLRRDIEIELASSLESFYQFIEFYIKLIQSHKKCKPDCLHLAKFEERIKVMISNKSKKK